jgi:TPR repeat protein
VPKDLTEAARLFREAAAGGHGSAMFQLGALYAEGRGVPKDLPYAHGLWRLAAEKGHAGAQDRIARLDVSEEELVRSARLAEEILNGRR